MQTFSYSKLKAFEQCPQKYKLKYIDRVKVEFEKTIEQFVGEKVHESLELLYHNLIDKKIPSLSYLMTKFDMDWKKSFRKEKLIVNSDEDFYRKAAQCVENYYNKNAPFADDHTIAIEKRVEKNFNNFVLNGYIDRLEFDEKYTIHDYKTSKFKECDAEQMKTYQLCLGGNADYVWHFLYLNDTEKQQGCLDNFENIILEKINKIEKEKVFEKKISNRCNWCEFKETCSSGC